MPLLDVSDVLADPDFATVFDVLRNATATSQGKTVLTPTTFSNIIGVVTPATSNELQRMPDTERMAGSITIRTVFRLTSGDAENTADIITWRGRQYTVESLQDWSEFGAGYVEALASALSLR